MTCILFFRWGNKPENKVWWNRTKHPTRWDSMPHCYFSLPTIFLILQYDISFVFYFHWDDRIHIAHAMFGSMIWSLHEYYFYVVDTWEIFTTYSCTSGWQTTPYCRWVTFTIHKLLVETLMYMHGSRYVVMLLMKLCEGSPPKNTRDIVDEFVWGESPQDHLWYLLMMVTMLKEIYACFMSNS